MQQKLLRTSKKNARNMVLSSRSKSLVLAEEVDNRPALARFSSNMIMRTRRAKHCKLWPVENLQIGLLSRHISQRRTSKSMHGRLSCLSLLSDLLCVMEKLDMVLLDPYCGVWPEKVRQLLVRALLWCACNLLVLLLDRVGINETMLLNGTPCRRTCR